MVLTNSVLRRRYTPPTCTLQIVARRSPLPGWMGRPVNKLLQFDLRFDDPRLPEEKQIHIQGDRDQLESLHEAVTVYTQNLLNQSPERFNTILSVLAPPYKSDGAVSPQALDSITYNQALSEEPRPLVSAPSTHLEAPVSVPQNSTTGLFGKIFLQPGRGLSHKLFLGALATEETGSVIQLSVLQLFDLVTALDEYAADAAILPALNRSSAAASSAPASIAAVLLVAVGLTTAVLIFNRSNPQQQIASRSYSQGSSSSPQQPIALQPSPLAPLPVPTPPSSPALPTPPLPSLDAVPSPIPSVTVPGTLPNPDSSLKASRQKPTPPVFNTVPRQDSIDSLLRGANGSRTSGPQTLNIPAPPAPPIPSPNQLPSFKRDVAAPADQSSGTPTAQQRPNAAIAKALGLPTPLVTGNGNAPSTSAPSNLSVPNEPKRTALFDITPQIAEVRGYFKQRWNPPSGLNEPLQYSIVLDVDGSIQRIIPLGQASINYVDRSSMPQIGKRFVSPNSGGQTPRIRVVLFPDRKVQVFPELSN